MAVGTVGRPERETGVWGTPGLRGPTSGDPRRLGCPGLGGLTSHSGVPRVSAEEAPLGGGTVKDPQPQDWGRRGAGCQGSPNCPKSPQSCSLTPPKSPQLPLNPPHPHSTLLPSSFYQLTPKRPLVAPINPKSSHFPPNIFQGPPLPPKSSPVPPVPPIRSPEPPNSPGAPLCPP